MLPNEKSSIIGEGMRWIYISPHFDDAVLSCGGLIWEQTHSGIPVEIWTIMAGDPPLGAESTPLARQLHDRWQTASAGETVGSAARRRPELGPAGRGFHPSLPLPGCHLPPFPNRHALPPGGIFVPNPREAELVEEIASQVAARLKQYDTDRLPADHRRTRGTTF